MAEFLVELYVSRANGDAVEHGAERTRLAAEELTREGTPVRYLNSIFVPEDETCFYFYEAASADGVRQAATRAALPFERVIEAIAETVPPRAHPRPVAPAANLGSSPDAPRAPSSYLRRRSEADRKES